MGKKMNKGIKNGNLWLCIGAVFFSLIGLAGIIFSLIPNLEPVVSKEFLQSKKVTVSKLDYHIRYRSANTYYIRTMDGEQYIISGSFDRRELTNVISAGKAITVKWYHSKPFGTLLAEEIYVDEKQVVFYDNDKILDWKISFFLGCLSVFMGFACFAAIRYDRKLTIESQDRGSTKRKNKNRKR